MPECLYLRRLRGCYRSAWKFDALLIDSKRRGFIHTTVLLQHSYCLILSKMSEASPAYTSLASRPFFPASDSSKHSDDYPRRPDLETIVNFELCHSRKDLPSAFPE